MNTKLDVASFMRAGGHEVSTKHAGFYPSRLDQANLYFNLVAEEFEELSVAYLKKDIVEVADACADLIWVVEGLMYSLGFGLRGFSSVRPNGEIFSKQGLRSVRCRGIAQSD